MATLLDCTIRDGSYVIGFQWAEKEVEDIVGELASAGITYLEVGHGLGLGASRTKTPSLISDKVYTEAAARVKGNSKIAAFFIPGIGNMDDLKEFSEHGGDVVRIGTNASESEQAAPFIEYARELGLEVAYNFMKSYAITPFEICRRAKEMQDCGAQILYLVDSAGGMLPKQVEHYVQLLVECLDVPVGFHGHNNLLMANANALAAIEAGAEFIDSTLLGMGRGAGNTQTESIIVVLSRAGINLGIDPLRVAKVSEKHIAHKSDGLKGADSVDLLLGYALFHDAYLNLMEKCASEYGVDFDKLVIEVSKINKMDPSEDLVRNVAGQLRDESRVEIFAPKFYHREIR